jgi:hypothetical protein
VADAGRPVYVLTLRAEPDAVPPAVRLRRLLKALLRAWAFQCVEVREVTAGDCPGVGYGAKGGGDDGGRD